VLGDSRTGARSLALIPVSFAQPPSAGSLCTWHELLATAGIGRWRRSPKRMAALEQPPPGLPFTAWRLACRGFETSGSVAAPPGLGTVHHEPLARAHTSSRPWRRLYSRATAMRVSFFDQIVRASWLVSWAALYRNWLGDEPSVGAGLPLSYARW